MSWQKLTLELDRAASAAAEQALQSAGALSVSLQDAGDEPVLEPAPGETPLWPRLRLTALFPRDTDPRELGAQLRAGGIDAYQEWDTLADEDWERARLRDTRPRLFADRLWVCPAQAPEPPHGAVVRLDAGLAFGTGEHETTALCLEWLARLPLDGGRMLDYGCGSGILAIAALRLGALRATAVDIDPQALTATRENAQRNSVAGRIAVLPPVHLASAGFDTVIANILAGPLVDLAPRIAMLTAPGAQVALSGLLKEQTDDVAAAYGRWLDLEPVVIRGDWALLTGVRRGEPAGMPPVQGQV